MDVENGSLPETSRDRLLDALETFDEQKRGEDRWTSWQSNRNHEYAIEHEGRFYPVKEIVSIATGCPNRSFHSTQASSYVESYGLEVTTLRDKSMSGALEEVLTSYDDARRSTEYVDSDHPIWGVFEEIEEILDESQPLSDYPHHIQVEWSVGHGEWSRIPCIKLFDSRKTPNDKGSTASTKAGRYIIYLFREDLSGVYLTYSQGYSRPTKSDYKTTVGEAVIQNRMERMRRRAGELEEVGFTLESSIDLTNGNRKGREYEKSTIAYKLYETGNIPPDEKLLSDLENLLQVYDRHLSRKKDGPSLNLNRDTLESAVGNIIRPAILERGDLGEDGREGYHHNKIISQATPSLTPENLSSNPREAVLEALEADVNLLHHSWQRGTAEEFFRQADPERIQEEVSTFLYGSGSLQSRVRHFLEWGTERETESGKTAKLEGTTASYLLCLSDPQEYAFCKTRRAYRPAVKALLGDGEVRSNWPERIAHARDFYKEVLSIFQEEYDLPFFDLLHVHIAFFLAENEVEDASWGERTVEDDREPTEDKEQEVYTISAPEDGERWEECIEEGSIHVGGDKVGDLRQYVGDEELISAFYEHYWPDPYDSMQEASEKARELRTLPEIDPGDLIVANRGGKKVLAVGKVVAPGYDWNSEEGGPGHLLHVDWDPSYEQSIDGRPEWEEKIVKQLPSDFVDEILEEGRSEEEHEPYSIEDATEDLFYGRSSFSSWLDRLRTKKNLILQGPPGVGKTYVSKRLAYALIGEKDDRRVEMVQLHQSYTYEDFIRGYRPTSDGGFRLRDGVFFRFCERASKDSDKDYVFIIDEINRGNLSKIFGELMMLIEPDKRGPGQAMQLPNQREGKDPFGEEFYVPENLHLIGIMNTADRSLAMVDYALRRRFAFVDMEPRFHSDRFRDFLHRQDVSDALIDRITARVRSLNEAIAKDTNLGPGFKIGHSYFCPEDDQTPDEEWYEAVVNREIEPLLREYWFDDPETAKEHVESLRA